MSPRWELLTYLSFSSLSPSNLTLSLQAFSTFPVCQLFTQSLLIYSKIMPPYHLARMTAYSFRTSRLPLRFSRRLLSTSNRNHAEQSYGSGAGDPKGSDPQSQGASPATCNAEHPGPPPPDVGKGTGGGPTKKSGDGHHGGDAESKTPSSGGGSGGADQGSTGTLSKGGSPQPKILNEGPPADEHLSDDVKKHNEEMANRKDKPFEASGQREGDAVDKGYWKGELPCLTSPVDVYCLF